MAAVDPMTMKSAGRLPSHTLKVKPKRVKSTSDKPLPDKELQAWPIFSSKPRSIQDDEADRALDRLTPLLYARMKNSDVDDVQLFANFFQRYVGNDAHVFVQSSYLWALTGYTPTTPLLKCARRTISLTHAATVSQDVRLVRESRISYGKLLGLLQFSMTFPVASQNRELIASIALLTHLSDPSGSTGLGGEDWVTHFRGVQQLIANHGRACLNVANPLDAGLMRHAMLNGFLLAIAQRKRWETDTKWLQGVQSYGWAVMVQELQELPGLLERTDRLLSSDQDIAQLGDLVLQLGEMREKCIETFPEMRHPDSINTKSYKFMSATIEEHCVMADSNTFPTLFAPMMENGGAPAKDAFKFVYSTMLALISEITILRIWHFRPSTTSNISEDAQDIVEQSAHLLAKRLCKIVLSFTQIDKPAYVSVVRLCLTLARNVFEQQGALSDMGWCDACLIANQLRMQRIRHASPPTLCKVEDIIPAIAEAGRYKHKFDPQAFVIGPTPAANPKLP